MRKNYVHQITQKVMRSYEAIASEFNQTRRRQWPEFDHFVTYCKSEAKVLDLACGNGRFFEVLAAKKPDYLGVDHNSKLLEKAQENHPEAKFKLADMTLLDLPEDHFDNVYCIAAFHHIPTRKMRLKVLSDIHRSMKKDGVFIMTNWNLLQKKYVKEVLQSTLKMIVSFGLKGLWNDLWIKWGDYPLKRYYHAFLPSELKRLLRDDLWHIEEFYFTKKGKRVSFFRSFNLVTIVRKK